METHEHYQPRGPRSLDHCQRICCSGGRYRWHCQRSCHRAGFRHCGIHRDHIVKLIHSVGRDTGRRRFRRQYGSKSVRRHIGSRKLAADTAAAERGVERPRPDLCIMTNALATGPEPVFSTGLCALGTHVRLLTTDVASISVARAMLIERLAELDCVASRFRPSSELSRINDQSRSAAAEGRRTVTVPVSDLLCEHLTLALDIAARTGGLVTPTVGNDLINAGYDADIEVVRSRDEPLQRDHHVPGPADRVCQVDKGVLTLTAGVTLDLGCSAKAAAAQRWAAEIAARVGSGVLLDLGGDLASGGRVPRGGWQIGVVDWTGSIRQVLTAHDGQAFATSSTRVRAWPSEDGGRHHIIDPRIGSSARTPWAQVTCASTHAHWANAASTAAVILGVDAPDWLSANDIPALLIADDGTEARVAGWPTTSTHRDRPA